MAKFHPTSLDETTVGVPVPCAVPSTTVMRERPKPKLPTTPRPLMKRWKGSLVKRARGKSSRSAAKPR